ncbi:MAG: polymer-forming cytoskeletal protein [Bacteriovoracales bacterium]|jgi:cytoskeletal protein CcmA (bactofilin family)
MEAALDIVNKNFSLIGKGSKIKGSFIFSGLTRLNSHLEGEIVMNTQDDLSIEKDADIKAEIKCHNVNIFGIFEGNIFATGRVRIYPCANLKGTINASQIEIHPGALVEFEGHTENL